MMHDHTPTPSTLRRTATTRVLALGVALVLAVAACSSSDGFATDSPLAAPSTTTTEITETTTPTARPPATPTPEPSATDLATVLDEVIAGTDIPAIGVSMFDSEQILESAVTGVRRVDDPTKVELDDKFHIGSNAKAMTAVLVATYVDEGLVSFETTIEDVYGESVASIDDGLAEVTIRQLLNHTSGLDDDLAYEALETVDQASPIIEQRFNAAELVLPQAEHPSAGQYSYSNIGYTLVGGMLEQLTGSSWEELIQTRVFDELGMDSCGFYAPGTPGELDQPWGHWTDVGGRAIDPGDSDSDYPHAIAPAGLVHCSMADWVVFLQTQLRGFRGADSEIVSAESFAAIQAPPEGGDYALGWGTMPTPLGTAFWHHGGNDRFTSFVMMNPTGDSGIVVAMNIGEVVADPVIDIVMQAASNYALAQDQVDIGGRKMFITCKGSGSPTVVLEHGLGASGVDWTPVQSGVSSSTRVCYTSRPGMGLSEPVSGVRTAQDAADDLAAVLAAADVPGPYVVVGHSFGGLVVRLFADQHQDDVVGAVLVDTTHEDLTARVQAAVSPEVWVEVADSFGGSENAERMDLDASQAQVAAIGDLGDRPLVVLHAGVFDSEGAPPGVSQASIDEVQAAFRTLGDELQRDLATLSSVGEYVRVDDSAHFIQLDRPDAVIDAITSVVEQAR